MQFGVQKNLSRIQKALEAVRQLTPEQIQQLSKQESLSELRAKRIANLKSKLPQVSTEGEALQQKNQPKAKPESNMGVKWDLFKETPILSYRHSQRNYQEQFNSTIQSFRLQIRKEEEKKAVNNKVSHTQIVIPKQKSTKSQNQKNQGIFTAVFSNQTAPFKTGSQNLFTTQSSTQQNSQQNSKQSKKQTSNMSNLFFTPIPIDNPQNHFQIPSKPNLSIFTKKFDVPESMPPQPIKPKAGLFSESNPITAVHVTGPPIFNVNKPQPEIKTFPLFSNAEVKAEKPNIFAKTLLVEQNEQQKPFVDPKGSLFSNNNPWVSENENKNSFLSGTKLFNNQVEQQKVKDQKIQQSKVKEPVMQKPIKISIFQNLSKQPNIFGPSVNSSNSNSNTSGGLFSQSTVVSAPKGSNEGLFQNVTVSTPSTFFFTPSTSATNSSVAVEPKKEPTYQSGSLFTNTIKPAELIPKPREPKPEQKKNVFDLKSNPGESSIFGNKNQSQSLFGKSQTVSSATTPAPNIFSHQVEAKPQPKPQQKPSIFSNIQQETPSKSLFFNLIPVEQPKQETPPDDSQKAAVKKPTQLFGDFIKSKPDNMFAKESIFGAKKEGEGLFGAGKTTTPSIFGGLGLTGNIFGQPQGNLFAKKEQPGKPAGLFSTPFPSQPKQDEEQDGEQDGQQAEIIEAREEANPALSTGNYKYEQSTVKYRETVLKFKKGNENIIENVIISIQKFAGNQNHTLCVRFVNKCHYFTGTIVPGVTEISKIKQNEFKNLAVKKIVHIGTDGKPVLQLLKIQFKDDAQGQAFYNKFGQVSKKVYK